MSEADYWAWTRRYLDSDAELDAAVEQEDADNAEPEDYFADRLEEHPTYER